MVTKVTSTLTCFFGGRRYRPGEVFELPDGIKPSADMTVVSEKEPAKAKGQKPKASGPQTLADITKADSAAQAPKGAADDLV